MWQRFTQAARRVVLTAQGKAMQRGSTEVDLEHLLSALIEEGDVKAVLNDIGVQTRKVSAELAGWRPARSASQDEPKLSPRMKRVLVLAADEAMETKSPHVDATHLLLGLLRASGDEIAQVLRDACAVLQGVELSKARAWLLTRARQEAAKYSSSDPIEPIAAKAEVQAAVERVARVAREMGVYFSARARNVLVRAVDKALAANSDTIEFEHLVEAVDEAEQELK
jgi:ATP-dependent Clp protease ATP-binding subunit ClpA